MSTLPAASPTTVAPEPKSEPHHPGPFRRWVWPVLLFLVMIVVAAKEYDWLIERIRDADTVVAEKVGEVSIAGLTDDFMKRFQSCTYKALVICEDREAVACRQPVGRSAAGGSALADAIARASSIPVCEAPPGCDIILLCDTETHYGAASLVLVPIAGLQILPKIPDATLFVLKERLAGGDTVGFVLMVLFIILSLFGIVGTVLSGEKEPLKWAFFSAASVVLSPLFVSLGFGLIQLVLLALTGIVGLLLQALLLVAGIPAALLLWLKAGHDAHAVAHAAKAVARGE